MSKSNPYTDGFQKFWKAYPRKTAKANAFKAWAKNVDEEDMFLVKAIIDDLEKRSRLKWFPIDKTKIPHPATWINARRWEDEDWQDDVKTRGKDHVESSPDYKPRIEDDYGLNGWQRMLNRMQVKYMLAIGPVTEAMLKILIETKNEIHTELLGAVREEIDSAKDKSKATREMSMLFAEMLCSRFNAITSREVRPAQLVRSEQPTYGRKEAAL